MYLEIKEIKAISSLANELESEDELTKIITRAEMDIDRLTNFNIHNFEELSERVQKCIKFAVIAQTEYLILNGEYSSNIVDNSGVSIGAYSTANQGNVETGTGIADTVMSYLMPSGLLYAGVGVYRRSITSG